MAQAPITVFDRAQIRRNRERCVKHFHDYDFLFDMVEDRLLDRLQDFNRTFDTVAYLGKRASQNIRTKIEKTGKIKTIFFSDLSPSLAPDVVVDEELFPFAKESLDLIISPLCLHSVNDLPGALIQIKHALKPDGLFLSALFGGETLYELRDSLNTAEIDLSGGLSPRVFPFADKQQMGGLMQRAYYALPVVDSDLITVTYPTLTKLLHDIRGMGEGNAIENRSKTPMPRIFFEKAENFYKERYSENGQLIATFEVIFATGWAPHERQQKPLKPGSAEHRLADTLHTTEQETGDIVGS